MSLSTALAGGKEPASQMALKRRIVNTLIGDLKRQYGASSIKVSSLSSHRPPMQAGIRKDDKDDKKGGQNSGSATKAKELFEKLQKEKKDLPDYRTDAAVEFPLLVNLVTEGNRQVAICFNDVKIYPGYSEISMFLKIRVSSYTFFFGADKLKYRENSEGGFFESGRLVLLGDATYKTKSYSYILKGGDIKDNGNFGDATSVYYNCGKLETLKLGGELWLNPDYFVPLDKKGKPLKDSTERVITKLDATIDLSDKFKRLDEFIVKLSFSPFALKAYKDKVGFKVDNVTLDLSETVTPEGVIETLSKVDTLYKSNSAKKGKQWTGLYIEKLEVYLPEELSGKEKGDSTKADKKEAVAKADDKASEDKPLRSFSASNVVIGDVGLTGSFKGFNVVRLDDARPISKWDMSVDTVQIDFINSTCKKFVMKGMVKIPQDETVATCDTNGEGDKKEEKKEEKKDAAAKPDKSKAMLLAYSGLVSVSDKVNSYALAVKFASDRKFGFLGGEATLKSNSAVELMLAKERGKNARFEAKATLNGTWTFAIKPKDATTKDIDKQPEGCPTKDTTKAIGFRNVAFTDCQFMTTAPYFRIGSFAYSDTSSKFNNYPIFIEKFEVKTLAEKKDGDKKDADKKEDKKADAKDAKKDTKAEGSKQEQLAVNVVFRVSLLEKSLSGKGDIGLVFDYGEQNEKFRFAYNSVNIKEIELKGDFSAFKFEGGLKSMKKDPDYGDGFMGRLTMLIGKEDPSTIKMNAIYGIKEPVGRYFYLDGSYANPNAPVKRFVDKNLQINGIAAGLAIKMAPTKEASEFSVFKKKFVPQSGRYSLIVGAPFSNIKPKPGDLFDGNALLTVNIGGSYGIASVLAYGDVRVKAKSYEVPNEASLKASFASSSKGVEEGSGAKTLADTKAKANEADGKKDAKTGAFVANIGAELDLERGGLFVDGVAFLDMGALTGGYEKNKVGDLTMYLGKEGFYSWLGTPTRPLMAQFDLGAGAVIRGDAYLDLGRLPPADQMVRKYPDGLISQLEVANKKAVERGYPKFELFQPDNISGKMSAKNGMLIGASLNIDGKEYRYDPFYARIGGGVGFDIVVGSYDNALCLSGARIDGMYGSGQFYLYANVTAGVEIPKWKWFGPWRFDVGDLNGLVIGKAGVPAPMYLDGLLYGKYIKKLQLLGYERTIIDKEFLFKINLGQECTPNIITPTAEKRDADIEEGIIWAGHEFKKEQKIYSKNKDFYIVYQNDGNLVSYTRDNVPLWASGTNGKQVTKMTFQKDGNIVAYNDTKAVWSSDTYNKNGQALIQQGDGNLVIYDSNEKAVWSTGTYGFKFPKADEKAEEEQRGIIRPPFTLAPNQEMTITSGGERYSLKFQPDGNLVVYRNGTSAIWSSNTWGKGITKFEFEGRGNLVFKRADGSVPTGSGTHDKARYLQFGKDGLKFYNRDNHEISYNIPAIR